MNYVHATMVLWTIWGVYWIARSFVGARTTSSESLLARASHLAPLFLAFFVFYAQPAPENTPIGLVGVVLTFVGMIFAFWARSHLGRYWSGIITLKEGHQLIRTGPYGLARHPIYTGVLASFLGSMLAVGGWRGPLAFGIVTVAFVIKAKREERNLIGHFGDEYRRYQADVKGIVPFVY